VARVRRRATHDLRRAFTNPFEARGTRPLLVHCGHHKAGTVWFRRILLTVSRHYGLRYRHGDSRPVQPEADLVFHASGGTFERHQVDGRTFRGSHLIRDPRDLVGSGYEYHLVTNERWALEPDLRHGGQSYQSRLRDLDPREGLLLEIERLASGAAQELAAWDYHQPEFIELRYEDVLDDEQSSFENMFRWYGLNDTAIEFGLEAVDRFSLKRGGARPNHVRSGVPGEWRARLGPEHVERFKELTGDLVVRLGYESTSDW
jgi:hypothetical protein